MARGKLNEPIQQVGLIAQLVDSSWSESILFKPRSSLNQHQGSSVLTTRIAGSVDDNTAKWVAKRRLQGDYYQESPGDFTGGTAHF